ncbi:MAG: hypothetical protein ABS36_06010 [Acidobacteria bacterium SCN 69-37]|nr:MAG: hypothetical protein ABS36_06010 [Acidobacteria bacterium SCN 69-37]
MRTYPALDITFTDAADDDRSAFVLAAVDDCGPIAAEEHAMGMRVFFESDEARDAARPIVQAAFPAATITAEAVPDEDWAERSQASLRPVRVGRFVVSPPWAVDEARTMADDGADDPDPAWLLVIQPSMGFGTGHHQSTRLCLRLLQQRGCTDADVLDIGTGSAVLAIAARRLGARRVVAVDVDRDALTSAAENVELNQVDEVVLDVADITQGAAPLLARHDSPAGFDRVFANITGAMLQRHAAAVAATVASGGLLITSGFQTHERDDVAAAFGAVGFTPIEQGEEDTWMAIAFGR